MAAYLSFEQQKVKSLVEKGFSVFVTGQAGSGKSFFLRKITTELHNQYPNGVYITAPTGIAAANIGGSTIHSFAAIGTGSKSAHELVACIQTNPVALQRWKSCQILVIDEVSMLSRELFEKLEFIARAIKQNDKPFGGIQLLFTGDFFQLKPVVISKDEIFDGDVFCFASPMWEKCIDFNVFLCTVYRQSQPELIDVLNDFRSCKLSSFSTNFVRHNLSRPLPCGPLDVVRLYSHKRDVCEANASVLSIIPGESLSYVAKDSGDVVHLSSCTAQKTLTLKVNTRVVLLKNISNELVNGLRGYVTSFVDGFPLVKFDSGKVTLLKESLFTVEEDGVVVATRRQVPLDLAYALTIHRSQGMGFDFVEVHVDKVFEPGQSYVALSRARTVEGLRVVGHIKNLPQISPLVENFYKNKVVSVQGINLDVVDIQPKRREVYAMPVLQVDKASPVPSGIPEPEEIILTQDYQDKAVPEDALKEILTRIKKDCEISKDCDDVASELQLTGECIPIQRGLLQFFTWLWCLFSQISEDKSDGETPRIVERKKWAGHTKNIHALYRSKQLLVKWKESLTIDEIAVSDEDIGIGGKHRKAAVAFSRATYEVFTHQQAKTSKEVFFNDPSNFKQGPVQFVTKESQGKIRDLGGWVLSEEMKACLTYINSRKGSTSKTVMEKVEKKRKEKKLLDSMTQKQEETVMNTKYPETLEHILNYDRGAKTHISDTVFNFFIELGSCSTMIFSEQNLHRYKGNALSIAYSKVKTNNALQKRFQQLITELGESDVRTSDDSDINTFDADHIDGAKATCASDADSNDPEYYSDGPTTCTSYDTLDADPDTTADEYDLEDAEHLMDICTMEEEDADVTMGDCEDCDPPLAKADYQLNDEDTELEPPIVEDVEETDFEFHNMATKVLFFNIVHRFCNMLSAETVRKFKRNQQLAKKAALRQGLQGKQKNKKTATSGPPTIDSIVGDPTPKHSSHYSLKALAYKGESVFTSYSHSELKFIMSGYGLTYSRANKTKQSEKLATILKMSPVMPNPEKLTKENFDLIKKGPLHAETTDNNPEVQDPQVADTSNEAIGIMEGQATNPQTQTTGRSANKRKCSHCQLSGHRKTYRGKITCPSLIAQLPQQSQEN